MHTISGFIGVVFLILAVIFWIIADGLERTNRGRRLDEPDALNPCFAVGLIFFMFAVMFLLQAAGK